MVGCIGIARRSTPYDSHRFCRKCQIWIKFHKLQNGIRCPDCNQLTRGRSFASDSVRARKYEERCKQR